VLIGNVGAGEGTGIVHIHEDGVRGTADLAEVALNAVLGVGDDRTLSLFIPTDDVQPASLVASLAADTLFVVDLNDVHGLSLLSWEAGYKKTINQIFRSIDIQRKQHIKGRQAIKNPNR